MEINGKSNLTLKKRQKQKKTLKQNLISKERRGGLRNIVASWHFQFLARIAKWEHGNTRKKLSILLKRGKILEPNFYL